MRDWSAPVTVACDFYPLCKVLIAPCGVRIRWLISGTSETPQLDSEAVSADVGGSERACAGSLGVSFPSLTTRSGSHRKAEGGPVAAPRSRTPSEARGTRGGAGRRRSL